TVQASQGDSAGNTGTSAAVTFTVDSVAPRVTGVYVLSSAWTPTYLNLLSSNGMGSATLGYLMPTGSGQLSPLGWNNIDKISIVFSESVNVTQGALSLTGANVASYGTTGFAPGGNVATWTLGQNIPLDSLYLNL